MEETNEQVPQEDMIRKTPYSWCLDANIRIIDLQSNEEEWYFKRIVTKGLFLHWLKGQTVKENSTPRKPMKYLEYRMYGLVNYQLSGTIHAGIQFGHAVVEYQQKCKGDSEMEALYDKWASKDKTFIVLNGGSTNEDVTDRFYGSIQKYRDLFLKHGIYLAEFKEPDLNNTLTSFVFLVDERVFDRETYPDFVEEVHKRTPRSPKPTQKEIDILEAKNISNRAKWVEKIGGPKNDFLRTTLRSFRLA